ncbi:MULTISPECIES: DoxX family protein [unclassified Rothia (in: high G+C Gram-positive bacteria)]|uniref:DoxX family protein n=1 Tax=unclassified Rothia (in: high G+C Gram-positive bacteria) TaxID=2689056 RepID=UPI00195734B5|nr:MULTISPECIES: DoxX family membrane protein [unclassified Rothia (in: high G+C Gram-positive bacteria)]MBM7051055.1 DoxX family membrane protein [Rothia sp. ZJ1223]QRZ62240.1 DoxX family membrane protein [Rothia sp. ZJ932]
MSLVRRLARPALASSFIISGIDRLKDPASSAHLKKAVSLAASTNPSLAVLRGQERLVGQALAGAQVGAGVLFALGKLPRISSTVLLGAGALNAYIEHKAAEHDTKEQKAVRRNNLVKNGSLLGAIALASVDTDGNPSLAWRANKFGETVAKKSEKITADVAEKAEDIFGK